MTTKSIEEQIAAIRAATSKANVSRETALAFLISAGIIAPEPVKEQSVKLQLKNTK
ncbi:hypothetical protein [Mucilaginibacter dorajii]|nr:hypothetical protein [Mucilaginibacter dorajii]MCS3737198.1 putative membrane protein [Mucilaginibacter dorajii]